MSRRLLPLLLASAFALPVLAQPKSPASPSWSPDKTLVSRLSPATKVKGFEIRPPKGYTLQRKHGPNKTELVAWVSAPRKDGTRAYVMLATVTPPSGEENEYNAEQMLSSFLTSIQHHRAKDWKRSSSEHGTVNGLPFVRARWSGTASEAPFKMRGFQYVTTVGGKVIALSSQDMESYPEALKLAEASVLTFRKRGSVQGTQTKTQPK